MKANELRIGNLVSHHDFEGYFPKVIGIKSNGVVILEMPTGFGELHSADYEPIPLTEEWLLNFGFEKFVYDSEETGYGTEYKLKASEDVFMVYSDDFSLGLYSDESREENDMAVIPTYEHIKHVHQLQNLYFALTGEELTIKK